MKGLTVKELIVELLEAPLDAEVCPYDSETDEEYRAKGVGSTFSPTVRYISLEIEKNA